MKIADSPERSSRRDPESSFAMEISVTLDKKRVRWRALQRADYHSPCLAFLLEGLQRLTQFLLLEAGWITRTFTTGWSSLFLCEPWVASAVRSAFCSRVSPRDTVAVPHTSMDNLILFFCWATLYHFLWRMLPCTLNEQWCWGLGKVHILLLAYSTFISHKDGKRENLWMCLSSS